MATSYLNQFQGLPRREPLPGMIGPGPSGSFFTRLDPAAVALTPDAQSLAARTKRSRLAHEALMRAQAEEAATDNELLSSATEDELANLFGQPRTEREARLQQIVQQDYNAKERGNKFIWTEPQKTAYAQKLENLKRTRLANYLDPLQFGLERERFGETQNKNLRDYMNQIAGRGIQRQQLSATERFRDVQARNAEANRLQRERFRAGDFGQRERFHADSQSNQQLQAMMELERMLQNAAAEESRSNRGYYQDVAAASAVGALPRSQIGRFSDRFDPDTLAMLEGYARLAQNNPAINPPPPDNRTFLQTYLPNFMGGTDAPTADDTDYGDSMDDEEINSMLGIGSDFAPPSQAIAPRAQAPMPRQGGGFTPGTTVRNRQTGQVFRVGPNGNLVLVR